MSQSTWTICHRVSSRSQRFSASVAPVPTMTFRSHSDSPSIFRDGKLKLGFYKIQNLYSQTYLDIHEHSKELCCRPAQNLEEGRGLVRPFA